MEITKLNTLKACTELKEILISDGILDVITTSGKIYIGSYPVEESANEFLFITSNGTVTDENQIASCMITIGILIKLVDSQPNTIKLNKILTKVSDILKKYPRTETYQYSISKQSPFSNTTSNMNGYSVSMINILTKIY